MTMHSNSFLTLDHSEQQNNERLLSALYEKQLSLAEYQAVAKELLPLPIQPQPIQYQPQPVQRKIVEEDEEFVNDDTLPALYEETKNFGSEELLAQKIKYFSQRSEETLLKYLNHSRSTPRDCTLTMLNGFKSSTTKFPLEHSYSTTGSSCFIRWNEKGIVINPGSHFLENFHKKGFHLSDIDAVIITEDNPNAYTELQKIYDLNNLLNQSRNEPQPIRYYLAAKAHHNFAGFKPSFKQEVFSLEVSNEREKIEIAEGLNFYYFPLYQGSIGLKFELENMRFKHKVHIGFLSQTPWNLNLNKFLKGCHLIIASIGSLCFQEFKQKKVHPHQLGMLGIQTLFFDLSPKLFLCNEFCKAEGEVRLEAIKVIRERMGPRRIGTLLPADIGLQVDLQQIKVRCSLTKAWINPHQIKVMRTKNHSALLHYLSKESPL